MGGVVRKELGEWLGVQVHLSIQQARSREEMIESKKERRERWEAQKEAQKEEMKGRVKLAVGLIGSGEEVRRSEWVRRIQEAMGVSDGTAYDRIKQAKGMCLVYERDGSYRAIPWD